MSTFKRFLALALNWCHTANQLILGLRAKRTAPNARPDNAYGEKPLVTLQRDQVLLVVLSLADGQPLTPVQVQKSLFLADDKVTDAFEVRYDFQPYDYGPFDRHVYTDAQALSREGLVEIGTDPRGWSTYAATPEGVRRGQQLRQSLNESQLTMLSRIVSLVRRLSFTDLVSAIYRSYPHMRERSVFRD